MCSSDLPVLKAALSREESRGRALQIVLSAVETELKKRIADCKPPEAPKEPPKEATTPPPQVALAQPPAAKPAPAPAPSPQAQPPRNPYDNRLRLPPSPTHDYSFMSGCWRTDPFRHEAVQMQPGISSYCFDASGNGQLEWRRGRTACRTRAQARFEGATLRLRDGDTTCNDGSRWYADQLVDRKSTRLNSSHSGESRMPSSA